MIFKNFSKLFSTLFWNHSVTICCISVQQKACTQFRLPITFQCMFITTKFHSQKWKFPMPTCLAFAEYFSGREVVADKIRTKTSNNWTVTKLLVQINFSATSVTKERLHILARGKGLNWLLPLFCNKLSACMYVQLSWYTVTTSVRATRFV